MFLPKLPVILCAIFLAIASAGGVTYTEVGDAGRLRNTAQPTAATQGAANQPLSAIFGNFNLANGTDIDLFIINITNPAGFSATTSNSTTGTLDTSLFLFDANGRPVYANDDVASGVTSALPAANTFSPTVAGLYYLGIAYSGAIPVNAVNIDLFAAGSSTDVRGPNASASGPLTNWDTSQITPFGTFPANYEIDLTGATTAAVPEPTTLAFALIGLAGLVGLKKAAKSS